MLKVILTYFVQRMKFRKALRQLNKADRWSIDFILYLLKSLPKGVKYVRRTYAPDGTLVGEDIITTETYAGIDYKQQEIDMAKDSEQAILDELYKELD